MALTAWTPDSTIGDCFRLLKRYMPAAPIPPPPFPFVWGNRERVRELLGDAFDLRFESGSSVMRVADEESAWDLFVTGYGPLKSLHASLDQRDQARLRRDFMDLHTPYRTELGVALPRDYVLAVGVRR